jgi:CheY-like chemotaxis protein
MDIDGAMNRQMGRKFNQGEVIFKKGDKADRLYVVQSGQVEIVLQVPEGEDQLTLVGPGQIFGETALFLPGRTRMVTARASESCQVLTIDEKTLISKLHHDPGLAFRLIRHMSQRISDLDQQRERWIPHMKAWEASDPRGFQNEMCTASIGAPNVQQPEAKAPQAYDFSIGYRILMVEDDPDFRLLVERWLMDASMPKDNPLRPPSCGLTHAENLHQALDRLSDENFDLVLLDLNLPDSQGMASFQRIFEQAPHTPVVVVSGMDNEDQALNAVRIGAQDYLVKDQVTKERFVRAVRYALARHRFLKATVRSEGPNCCQGSGSWYHNWCQGLAWVGKKLRGLLAKMGYTSRTMAWI